MSGGPPSDDTGGIRAFLIADIRGYSTFSSQRGDEAAAHLAALFARVAREEIDTAGGSVIELRGDEALAVFTSPRKAIAAAVRLQERFAEESTADPEFPLPVGIGLDAGEAVPVEGGWRGRALNMAARLCARAAAGETLATAEIVHLAGNVELVRFEDRGAAQVKGFAEPVRVIAVSGRGTAAGAGKRPPWRRPVAWAAAGVVAAAIAALAVLLPGDSGAPPPKHVPVGASGGLYRVNIPTGEATAYSQVPASRDVVVAGGYVWVEDDRDQVVKVNPRLDSLDPLPPGLLGLVEAPDGTLWAVRFGERHGPGHSLGRGAIGRLDAHTGTLQAPVPLPSNCCAGYVVDGGTGWFLVNDEQGWRILRITLRSGRVTQTLSVSPDATHPEIAVGGGSIWVSDQLTGTITRFDERTGRRSQVALPSADEMIFAFGLLWVADATNGQVQRIDPDSGTPISPVQTGGSPRHLAVDDDSVWVFDFDGDLIHRIDPGLAKVTGRPVHVPGGTAIAAGAGAVWVASCGGQSVGNPCTFRD